MDIPAKVTVPICIEQGLICHYFLETVNKDGTVYKGNRFFVVLNSNPKNADILILVTITKQVANQREYVKKINEDPDTLISVSPSDFPRLNVDSVVNCNNVYETSLKSLINRIDSGGKVFFEKLPKIVVDALVRGVLKSKQVSSDHKKMLL